jgi:hypothetical protein
MLQKECKEENFPKHPLERSYKRTVYMWGGFLHMLKKNDYYRLWEALRSVGLADKEEIYYGALFELDPSDDTLRRLKKFYELKTFPKAKGKKRERDVYWGELLDELLDFYYAVLRVIKTLPPRSKPESRSKALRDRCLPKLLQWVNIQEIHIDDRLLRRWCGLPLGSSLRRPLPDKKLAEEIIAHICGIKRETLRKYLTKAKRKVPKILLKGMMEPERVLTSRARVMELLTTPLPDTEEEVDQKIRDFKEQEKEIRKRTEELMEEARNQAR